MGERPEEDASLRGLDINSLLSEVFVGEVDEDMIKVNEEEGRSLRVLAGWSYVSVPDSGPVAYFAKEEIALRFRLDIINRVLNG